jgi:hypothetical protein
VAGVEAVSLDGAVALRVAHDVPVSAALAALGDGAHVRAVVVPATNGEDAAPPASSPSAPGVAALAAAAAAAAAASPASVGRDRATIVTPGGGATAGTRPGGGHHHPRPAVLPRGGVLPLARPAGRPAPRLDVIDAAKRQPPPPPLPPPRPVAPPASAPAPPPRAVSHRPPPEDKRFASCVPIVRPDDLVLAPDAVAMLGRGVGVGAPVPSPSARGVRTAPIVLVDGAGCRWDVAWVHDTATGLNGFAGAGWRAFVRAWGVAPGGWALIEACPPSPDAPAQGARIEVKVALLGRDGRPTAREGQELLPIVGAAALRGAAVRVARERREAGE